MGGSATRIRQAVAIGMLVAAGALARVPAQAAALPAPPAPQAVGLAPLGSPGTIYYGAVPPGGGGSRPVLVFVQGLHGQASTWWTNGNDMYADAYYGGFRTAFVDLIDAGGTGGSVEANGAMLAGQLTAIAANYGVPAVNVVAHSKGGLDTNAAVVEYGAAPEVETLFQLGSPNWGSPLADLAYSWWGGWLAAILGQRDAAVYSLQTGQMAAFRAAVDPRPENGYVHYRTAAGTSHGSIFGALWYGGAYLSFWGANDGAVTLDSAHHPLGVHVFTDGSLDHDQLPTGHYTWSRIMPVVGSLWRGDSPEPGPVVPAVPAAPALPAGAVLRGGPVAGTAVEAFPVESGAGALQLAVLTSPGVSVALRGPDGSLVAPSAVQPGNPGEPLGGAVQHLFAVDHPAPGAWTAEMRTGGALSLGESSRPGAYLLVAETAGPLAIQLVPAPGQTPAVGPGGTLTWTLAATDGGVALQNLQVTTRVDGAVQPQAASASGDTVRVTLPAGRGVAPVAVTVRGLDAAGLPFERSLATSVAVGAAGSP